MPYKTEWVPPDVFLEHKGVTVYHTYSEDEADSPKHFWYSTDPDGNDGLDDGRFDVRDLKTKPLARLSHNEEEIKAAIIAAIDSGELKAPKEET